MQFCLGLQALTLPDESGRLRLRDPAQGPMLDEALKLTQPSKMKGSKRTRGDEVLAGMWQGQARERGRPTRGAARDPADRGPARRREAARDAHTGHALRPHYIGGHGRTCCPRAPAWISREPLP